MKRTHLSMLWQVLVITRNDSEQFEHWTTHSSSDKSRPEIQHRITAGDVRRRQSQPKTAGTAQNALTDTRQTSGSEDPQSRRWTASRNAQFTHGLPSAQTR